jgi:hypothetical protein
MDRVEPRDFRAEFMAWPAPGLFGQVCDETGNLSMSDVVKSQFIGRIPDNFPLGEPQINS